MLSPKIHSCFVGKTLLYVTGKTILSQFCLSTQEHFFSYIIRNYGFKKKFQLIVDAQNNIFFLQLPTIKLQLNGTK